MSNSHERIKETILGLLETANDNRLAQSIIEQKLSLQYSIEDIKNTIINLLNEFVIDLVVDYPSDDSRLNTGHLHWYVKLLSKDDSKELQDLSLLDLNFLRVLQQSADERYPGEVTVEQVESKLISKGFPKNEVKWLSIPGRTRRVETTSKDGLVSCYILIPEYEKTEEYRSAQEKIDAEYTTKESLRMFIEDTRDLASEIRRAVRTSPKGVSKKDIIKQLFMDDSQYVNEAFAIVLDEDEIIPVTLENGEEGYRINPDFDEDD